MVQLLGCVAMICVLTATAGFPVVTAETLLSNLDQAKEDAKHSPFTSGTGRAGARSIAPAFSISASTRTGADLSLRSFGGNLAGNGKLTWVDWR